MSIPLVPELLRSHLSKLAEADMRIDGRSRFESRETTLETGTVSYTHLTLPTNREV